jgi:hypothetical protein
MEKKSNKGKISLLIGLALLLIAGGIGFFFIQAHQLAIENAKATAMAQSNATATIAAYTAATNTAQQKFVTATAANATATATGFQNLYKNASSGAPALDDPLSDNNKGFGWIEGTNNDGGTCAFTGGAYHVSQSNTQYFNYCVASSDFSNFVFEVQMKIIKGDAGGVIFRADTTSNKFYVFDVGQDGTYEIFSCTANSCDHTLTSGTSTVIKQGLNQTNLIAVIAQGSIIGLYVNHQLIDHVDDRTYSSGQIGVIALPYRSGNPTEVSYNYAKVWIV